MNNRKRSPDPEWHDEDSNDESTSSDEEDLEDVALIKDLEEALNDLQGKLDSMISSLNASTTTTLQQAALSLLDSLSRLLNRLRSVLQLITG